MRDLLQFNAHEFIEKRDRLYDVERSIDSGEVQIPPEKKADIDALLIQLMEDCGNLDLEVSIDQAIRVMDALAAKDATYQNVGALVRDLRLRIDDELKV